MGSTSATSQAAAVSALLRKKADVMPRPSGASNAREYAVIVRRGTLGMGASIAVGSDSWTSAELDAVSDRIGMVLHGAGYAYTRSNLRGDRMVYFREVKKSQFSVLMQSFILLVRGYAIDHYGEHGWDEVVEAWTDEDIALKIGKARTAASALSRVRKVVELRHAHAEEIRSTAF